MGLFALLARFLPRLARGDSKPQFAYVPVAPQRLERRRVLDAAGAGLALEAIPAVEPFVQAADFATAEETPSQQDAPAAIHGGPHATIRLREAELFEDQSTLAVVSITDDFPMAHQVTIDWGDGSAATVINAGANQRDVLAVHKFLDDPTGAGDGSFTVTATITNTQGETATTTATILVKNVAPKIDSLSITSPINENGTATLSGTYSDAGTLDTHSLDIDWDGNGTFDQTVTVTGGTFSVSRQFLDDNPTGTVADAFNVNVRLRDDDGGQATRSAILIVRNVAPTITNLQLTSPVVENGTATLTGTYTDPGTLDTHTLDIDWNGDGTFDQTVAVSGGSFTVSRQFLDDNPTGVSDTFNVNVRLRDDDGGQATASRELTIQNANPVLVLNAISAINENGTAVLTGTYSDVGTLDTHQLDIDWDGDGTFEQTVAVTGGAFTVTRQFLDDNPTGTPSDKTTVNVRLRDDDGGVDTGSTTLEVVNVKPAVAIVPPPAIAENGVTTLNGTITDVGTLDTFTLTINWGDPSSPDNVQAFDLGTTALTKAADGIDWDPATRQFSVDHQYLDDNPSSTSSDTYNIVVGVTDDDTGAVVEQTTVSVQNADPVLADVAITSPITENSTATLTGTYTDAGTRDTHTLDIDWDGDGTFDQTVAVSGGNFTVSHQFLDDNPSGTASDIFNVNVRLRDDDGGTDTATVQLTVENADPIVVLNPIAAIDENGTAILTGTYSDVGTQDTHILDIDWDGDGTFDQTVAVSGGSFTVSHQFLDDNPTGTPSDTFNVNVRLRDDDGGVATDSTTLEVINVKPAVTLVPPAAIVENGTTTLSGTITDVGSRDTFTLVVNWGDPASPSNQQTFNLGTTALTKAADGIDWDPATRQFSVDHQFLDDNPTSTSSDTYNIVVGVTDDDTGAVEGRTSVTVRNADPVLANVSITSPVNENDSATLTGTYTDAGTQDTHELDIDWDGDGTFDQTVSVSGGSFTVSRQFLDDNPTATPSDTFNVSVRLRDDDGGVATASRPLTVRNVDPAVTAVVTRIIDENQAATLGGVIRDVGSLDTFTLVVNWGDPASPDNIQVFGLGTTALTKAANGIDWDPTTRQYSIDHQYLDDNPSNSLSDTYSIQVVVIDDDAGADLEQTSLVVRNVDPVLNAAGNQTVNEGSTLDLGGGALGTFTDQGTLDTHTATINWGDGTGNQNVVVSELNGSGNLSASHIFADNGVYTVTVTLADDDGGSVVDTFQVTVINVNPVLTGTGSTIKVDEGQLVTLGSLGVGLKDPGFDNPLNPLTPGGSQETLTAISINWGDGTNPQSLSIGVETDGERGRPTTATLISPEHAYADNGTYTVSVTIRDDDGSEVTRQFTIVVNNVDPTLQLTQRFLEINEGDELDLSDLGVFQDAGFNNAANPNGASVESFHYSIDWGDGTLAEEGQSPASVTNGSQGIKTTGKLADSHRYLDNDADNQYTITVTLFDDDGGSVTEQIQVRVLNVNPTLNPLVATDVTTRGVATVTVTFDDPGADDFTVHIDWGDNKPDAVDFRFDDISLPFTHTFVHQYDGPPDPNHPTDPITISVFVTDDDFGDPGVVQIGLSNTETVEIKNPGIGAQPFRIDTTPRVPQLTFPVRDVPLFVANNSTTVYAGQQTVGVGGSSGETLVGADRYIELCVLDAEGNPGPGYRLRPDVLQDLPGLFRTLPDNHYAVYVVNTETGSRRLVIEVFVRNGKLIDPGDDSEGTRDRPPTDEQKVEPAEAKPIEAAPVTLPAEEPASSQQTQMDLPVTFPAHRFSRWTALAVGLAASSTAQSWAHRVDEALAKATAEQWRKLQGHNPSKPKKP